MPSAREEDSVTGTLNFVYVPGASYAVDVHACISYL